MQTLSTNLRENMDFFQSYFQIDMAFDLISRPLIIAGTQANLYFIDGLVKDDIIQRLMEYFVYVSPKEMTNSPQELSNRLLPYGSVAILTNMETISKNLLSGLSILLVDGFDVAFSIDCRSYPARGVQEPEKDKVMRGSKDGFVETLTCNTALIRRRIRSPKLRMEIFAVGDVTKTDVVISYLDDRVDKKLLNDIRTRIQNIKIEALSMNQESLVECLYRRTWINPFPKYKFTERPDTVCASLLEGNIIILVDNSPSAIILPTSIFDIIEEADDYYFPPVTGTYLRFSRFITNIVALLLTPTFLLLLNHPQWIPAPLYFITITDDINVLPIIQFLILEFCIDGLRLAALNTPSMLSTPLSIVAGIVLGDFTVTSGWFNSECMLYMAFVSIATYSQASFELGYALKFMRILLLIVTQLFGIIGFVLGVIFVFMLILTNHTISEDSFVYPLIPLHKNALLRTIFRVSLPTSEKRKH